MSALEGDPVDIQCSATCNPPCVFTWTHPDGAATSGQEFSLDTINRSEAGEYICEAGNEVNALTAILTLAIYYPPQLYITVNPDDLVEGATAILVCRSDASPSQTMFTWSNKSQGSTGLEGNIASSDTESNLEIENVTCQKSSQIVCSADNGIQCSPVVEITELNVKCKSEG